MTTFHPSKWLRPEQITPLHRLEIRRDERWQKNTDTGAYLRRKARLLCRLTHLQPGQSILELGSGNGQFSRCLDEITQSRHTIGSMPFSTADPLRKPETDGKALFDLVVCVDLFQEEYAEILLQLAQDLLSPEGQVIFLLRNQHHPFRPGSSSTPPFVKIYHLLRASGFERPLVAYQDFSYGLPARLTPLMPAYYSSLLENIPLLKTFADSILIQAYKPAGESSSEFFSPPQHPSLRQAVSVIVPCRNEEMNVLPLVHQIKKRYGDYLHEIILVDDNSEDRTPEILQQLADIDPLVKIILRTPPNGVGRALRDGLDAASGAYVLTLDCDAYYLLSELENLFAAAEEGFDLIIGSRFSAESALINYPFFKIIANRSFHWLVRLLLRRPVHDLTNNLKLMRKEVAENLPIKQPGFAANAETGLYPLLMGYSVKEVTVPWINRTPDMGSSSFRLFRVGKGYLQVLWNCCIQSRFGSRRLRT